MKVLTGKEYGELFSEPVDDDCLSYPVNMTEASERSRPDQAPGSPKHTHHCGNKSGWCCSNAAPGDGAWKH